MTTIDLKQVEEKGEILIAGIEQMTTDPVTSQPSDQSNQKGLRTGV